MSEQFKHTSRILLLALLALTGVSTAAAAQDGGVTAGIGGGGTYYCISTRCGSGITVGALVELDLSPHAAIEIGARRMFCFDCIQFIVADAAFLLHFQRRVATPFIGIGVSRSSDSEFFGEEIGLLGTAGIAFQSAGRWGARLELLGRRVGSTSSYGELSLFLTRQLGKER